MDSASKTFEVVVVGGGLAGLSAAAVLSKSGIRTALVEQKFFPFHRVCGEYLSNEAVPFLERLGLNMKALGAAHLSSFEATTLGGRKLRSPLGLGGIGLSRFELDAALATRAVELGTELIEGARVRAIERSGDTFHCVLSDAKAKPNGTLSAPIVLGCFGKRSNLDRSLHRQNAGRRSDYVAAKQHFSAVDSQAQSTRETVSLHCIEGGYCGTSAIEQGRLNVCYLTTKEAFQSAANPTEFLNEQAEANPALGQALVGRKPTMDAVFISQVDFGSKAAVEDGVFMCGDAAGLIHPLCGNGMALALRTGNTLSRQVIRFLKGQLTRSQLERTHRASWRRSYGLRRAFGGRMQGIFEHPPSANASLRVARAVPLLTRGLLRLSHGGPF